MRLKKYKEEKDPWPPIKTKSYVTLAIVHQKELQTRQETTTTIYLRTKGDIHKIPHTIGIEKLTDIIQIFDPVSGKVANSILIEGHAGIGKTTLLKEICIQWAEGKLLTSDKLVLLLLLRDPNVQKITNEHELIEHFTNYSTTELYKELVKNHGADVTLMIDGFDELITELQHESFFRELIEKRCLSKARIVVTSRPSASACLHHVVDKRMEILGFEQSSKNQYVTEALQDHPSKLEKLQRHFQQYPNIDAICYIPLIMSIIVFLCMCQPDELPPTATKMYASFILHTICHYLKRVGKISEDLIIYKLEQFPPVVCIALQDLQKTAFDGLVEDKIVFTVKELPVLCKDDPTCYGLLQSTECYSAEGIGTPTQSFNFLHLGIQEYFAAKYVTTLSDDKVYTLLKESFIVSDTSDTRHKPFSNLDSIPNPDSKSVRLSNMWILYCGITSGQCKTLRHYLTTYGKPDPSDKILAPIFPPTMSLQPSSINPSYHPVTPPTQLAIYSRYPLTPSRGQHTTSYTQPYHLPTQQQQLVQYPYHQPSITNPLLSGYARSHDPMSHPLTMYRPTMTHSHRSHDQMFTPPTTAENLTSYMLLSSHMINDRSHDLTMYNPSMVLPHCSHDHTLTSPIQRYFTATTSKQVNSNIDSPVNSEKITGPSEQGSSSDQRISNTVTISQDVLKDPVKILYLFQCFQEAQDNELCEILSRAFDSGVIDINNHRLLPHQVVSLGFFLSKSYRKWNKLNLNNCHIRDHGMNIIHQYLCGDKANKQEIKEINLGNNDLTGASSHLIADIISHLQPHTLMLYNNNITNVRDISTAVINTSTVKMLNMESNNLTAQKAVAISNMMICLEKLNMHSNRLGDHGAELLSAEGITNTKTLRALNISDNKIGPSGTTAIANALRNNTSLEELDISHNKLGDHGAQLLSEGITNTKTLRVLNISGNNIGPSGTTAIANTLTNNTSLEELDINYNKLGDHGAELLSEGIMNTKTLRVLNINDNNIGPSGTTSIANALVNNTSLEELDMHGNGIGQDEAIAIAKAITNNKTLNTLRLGYSIDEESVMIITRSLHHNNTITKLILPGLHDDSVQQEVLKINNKRNKCNLQELVVDNKVTR